MQPISLDSICEQILAAATVTSTDSYNNLAITRVYNVLRQPEIIQALQTQPAFVLPVTDYTFTLASFAVFLANTKFLSKAEKQLVLRHVLISGLPQPKHMTLEKFYDFLQACPCFYRALYAAIVYGENIAAILLLQICGIEASDTPTRAAILTKLGIWRLFDGLLQVLDVYRDNRNYKPSLKYMLTLINQCQLVKQEYQANFIKQATDILQGNKIYKEPQPISYHVPALTKQSADDYENTAILALLDGNDAQSICAAAKIAALLNRLDDKFTWELFMSLARLAQNQNYAVAQDAIASITTITQLSLVDVLAKHCRHFSFPWSEPVELKNLITLYDLLTPAQIQDLNQEPFSIYRMYNIVVHLLMSGDDELAEQLLNKFKLDRQILIKEHLAESVVLAITDNHERAHQITAKFKIPLLSIIGHVVMHGMYEIFDQIAPIYYNTHIDPLISMNNFCSPGAKVRIRNFDSYTDVGDQYENYFTASLADDSKEQIDPVNDQAKWQLAAVMMMFIKMKRADLANRMLLKFNLNLDDLLAVALQQSHRTDTEQQKFLAPIVLILIKAGYINSAQKILQNPANNLTASKILSAILVATGKGASNDTEQKGTRDCYTNMPASDVETVLQGLSGLLSLITEQDTKIALNPEYTSGILTLTEFCQKYGRLDLIIKILSAFDEADYQDKNLAKIHEIIAPLVMHQDHKTKVATNAEQRQQLIMRDTHNSGHKMLTDALMQQFNQILAAFLSGVEAKPAQPLVRPTQLVKAAAPDAVALTSTPKITFAQVQQMIIMGFKQLTNNAVANRVTLSREQELLLNKFIAYHNNTHANFVTSPAALEQIDTTKHQMIVLDNHAEFGDNGKSMLIVEQQVNGTHRVVYFNTNGLAMSEDLKQLLKQKLGNDCVFVAASCPLQPNNLPNQDAAYKK